MCVCVCVFVCVCVCLVLSATVKFTLGSLTVSMLLFVLFCFYSLCVQNYPRSSTYFAEQINTAVSPVDRKLRYLLTFVKTDRKQRSANSGVIPL